MAKARSYLYVIGEDGNSDEVKIGRSIDPVGRRSTLQVGRGRKLKVHGYWPVPFDDAVTLEAAAHAALHEVRVKGEVFAVSPELACAFVEHIAQHGAADDFLRLGLAKERAERRWGALSIAPSSGGRWAKPEMVAALEAAEAEMKRLDHEFFSMDRARADKIDSSRHWLDKLDEGCPA
ncbi:GIY-YIG nuclease family protein [Methylobacterium bullatum]|uniref:Bacteriophage T5 Orf172 DNA-binding domain-containing protein n=1 Tax=Methylobacterium bullatum TaxID=570505 RepID=A0AAV4ZF13_9HYPH|nr:GIY-YIG nuclease family protein [Methylobacterium bullatum]GJD42070.1 hypothetical protein OICFNHDK_4561 [Methylobacterium bullatum]